MSLITIWINIFLVACVVSDILFARVFNIFSLSAFFISLLLFIFNFQHFNLLNPLMSFGIFFILGIALFKFKILGGGDVKAFWAIAIFFTPQQAILFISYSLIWAAVFSLIFYAVHGQLLRMLNTTALVYRKSGYAIHKVPFTVGILLGWFSLQVLGVWS